MYISKSPLENGKITKIVLGREFNEEKAIAVGSIELDIETQARFVDAINRVFEEGTTKLVVDMSNVNYIDSSGLWALFEGHKKACLKNGVMVLLKPSKDIKRVLDITKMSSKLLTFEAEKDALAHLMTA